MTANAGFVLEMLIPETALMSVDILGTDDPMTLEPVQLEAELTLELSSPSTESIFLDMVDGSIKGDKGDPGGYTSTKTAGAVLGGHRVVILDENGKAVYASSFVEAHANKVVGITTHAATPDALIEIQVADILEELSWNWTPDLPIFLGDNGMLIQNENETGVFVLQIATALSATKIYIEKQFPFFK